MSATDVIEREQPVGSAEGPPKAESSELKDSVGPETMDAASGYFRRRWTRKEFYMAAEAGIFKSSERLELINGEVYEQVSPQSSLHAWSILISAEVLRRTFGPGYMVREEKPILISDESEPEPDIAVVKGSPGDFQDHPRPESLALVMEVSESSLAVDTRFKSSLYASEGIPDYWVLNLKQRNLEVRREPYPNPEAPFGYSYKQIHIYTESDRVTPLFAPEGEIQVKDLLPPLPEEAGSGPQTEGTESE